MDQYIIYEGVLSTWHFFEGRDIDMSPAGDAVVARIATLVDLSFKCKYGNDLGAGGFCGQGDMRSTLSRCKWTSGLRFS
jgi:hypothetical protein